MNLYEKSIHKELEKWHRQMKKPPALSDKLTVAVQTRMRRLIPDKVQNTITAAVKKMTETIMSGSGFLTPTERTEQLSLSESDWLVEQAFKTYNKTAIAQGVGFGAGGVLLGLADFPALLAVKIKFLFDCAKLYGYDVNNKAERMYILYIFQLAFSGEAHRRKIYDIIMNWNPGQMDESQMDWESLQLEYRDYIDLAKLLQLLPVVGAVAGGTANYQLMTKLKITAMNCYRSRCLKERR